ncbi:MAG: M48 family metalloprotease [Gaiellales bacterium]
MTIAVPDETRARAYGRARRRIARATTAVRLVLVVLAALAGQRLARDLDVPGALVFDVVVYTAVLGAALELGLLPFDYARYRLSRRAGISRQRLVGWLVDLLKASLLGLVFATIAVTLLVWLVRIEPRWWWAIAAVAAIVFELALTTVAPVLLVPLFLRSRPLAAGSLRDDLLALAGSAGVSISTVRVLESGEKSASANAAVVGLGPTRRILLTDTLTGDETVAGAASIAETRAVLGHELGHHRALDIWRFALAGAASTFASLGVAAWIVDRLPDWLAHGGPRTLAGLPALALCLALTGLPGTLAIAAYSRRRERAADAFGVEVAGDGDAFARALEHLCETNLAERWPPRIEQLRSSHPAPGERIAQARDREAVHD